MEHCFNLIKNEIRITAGQKIIKGPDYRIRVAADNLIDVAGRVADHIRDKAQGQYRAVLEKRQKMLQAMNKTYHEAVQQGYAAGFDGAQQDYAAKINDALIDRAEIIDRLEYNLVDMLIESLKLILGDMGADQTVRRIATNALRKAGRAQFAKLRVHPDRVDSVQGAIKRGREAYGGLEWIEVAAEANLRPEDCLLQTSAGILDFSLDTQLRVLKDCLRARVRKAGDP